jgi:predicted nuclease with TOPRIM domain
MSVSPSKPFIEYHQVISDVCRAEAKLREISEQKAQLGQKIAAFRMHYESVREETDRLANEDRALERNFRKDLQEASTTPIDQDAIKIYLTLYKVGLL